MLDESSYRAIGSTEKEIGELTSRSRTAVLHKDWSKAAELSAQADAQRQRMATMGKLAATGKSVYDADMVVFEPFSPGKHLGPNAQAGQPGLHTQVMDALASLAKLDAGASAFYEKRRSYFSGLELASVKVARKGA